MMKKRDRKQAKALLLLLFYLFSNSPAILFHHHDIEIVTCKKDLSYRTSVYHEDNGHHCNHSAHLNNAPEKCSLCDHHTVSPHSVLTLWAIFFSKKISDEHLDYKENYSFQIPPAVSNKGPPVVSSRYM